MNSNYQVRHRYGKCTAINESILWIQFAKRSFKPSGKIKSGYGAVIIPTTSDPTFIYLSEPNASNTNKTSTTSTSSNIALPSILDSTCSATCARACGSKCFSESVVPAILPDNQRSIVLTYTVEFGGSFNFVKGGKLPGLYWGDQVYTGGKKGDTGGSLRIMWRRNGASEAYVYLPRKVNQIIRVADIQKEQFGERVGLDEIFKPEKPCKIRIEYVPTGSYFHVSIGDSWMNFETRSMKTSCTGILIDTFFGGGDKSFAAKKDESLRISDMQLKWGADTFPVSMYDLASAIN